MGSPVVFRLAVAALLVALTLPRMTQRGMFGDGLLYATIARNLSIGSGSFWAPRYTATTWPEFYEHPPLGFALEAGAFWLLGDHLIVERAFSLIVFGLHALVIALIWRRIQPAALDWLPLLFWLVPSIVSWGAVNNMLENTEALLTSTAILLLLAAMRARGDAATVMRSAGAGIAIVAAVLTKGPAGFYPLAAPLLFLLLPASGADVGASTPRRRAWLLMTISLIVAIAACGVALAAYPPSRHSVTMYLNTQLGPVLSGRREGSEPLAIVRHLGVGIIIRMTALLGLISLLAWRRRDPRGRAAGAGGAAGAAAAEMPHSSAALCFLGLGLCAALPIAISPKLSGHYLLPSVPMFALGFASFARGLISPRLTSATAAPTVVAPLAAATPTTSRSSVMASFGLALIVALVFAFGRGRSRDAEMLRELDAIEHAMPRDITIGACRHPLSARDWGLHTYVQRWFRVSLDAHDRPINGWLLRAGDECAAPSSCTPVARGDRLTLFRCPEPLRHARHRPSPARASGEWTRERNARVSVTASSRFVSSSQ